MQDFFKKHGVAVMTIRELFDFIVDPCIADDAIDSYLEEVYCLLMLSNFVKEYKKYCYHDCFDLFQVQQKILLRGDMTAEDEIADSVFVQVSCMFGVSLLFHFLWILHNQAISHRH